MMPLLTVVVPMPKSLRDNAKVTDQYRRIVAAACHGRKLSSGQVYRVTMTFRAVWLDAAGKVRRRDHLNYAAVLCDVLAAALGVDDSRFWQLELHKRTDPIEKVSVSFYLTSAT